MKKKRFTEEQIIAILREHEAGAKAADEARPNARRSLDCVHDQFACRRRFRIRTM